MDYVREPVMVFNLQYDKYQNHLNTVFKDYRLPAMPNRYGVYQWGPIN